MGDGVSVLVYIYGYTPYLFFLNPYLFFAFLFFPFYLSPEKKKMAAVMDFCSPAVPGESHKYYGYSHNKHIKLPHINAIPPTTTQHVKQNKSKEHKTLRSVALSGNLALLRQFLQMVPDQLKAVNDPHPATGLTCLHFAASRGHLKIITCLVEEYGVKVDSTDKEGEVL